MYKQLTHFALAFILFYILSIWMNQKGAFLMTIFIGICYEVSEYFWNLTAYSSVKHYLYKSWKDVLSDFAGAVVALGVI